MSDILVEDGSTYPASVTVPEDGDARNAASVVVGFQALANRAKYMFTKLVSVLINGGVMKTLADVEWQIEDDTTISFTQPGIGSASRLDVSDVQVEFKQNVEGPLFAGNQSGRANKKPLTLATGVNQAINPTQYDVFDITPSAAINVQIAAGTYVEGETFRVINRSQTSGRTITLKDPAGVTFGQVLINSNSDFPRYVDVMKSDTGSWVVIGHGGNTS